MYPEFIAIYIGLGILAILQIVCLLLVISLYKNKNYQAAKRNQFQLQALENTYQKKVGVVFCLNCGARFDAANKACPKCGKPRQ